MHAFLVVPLYVAKPLLPFVTREAPNIFPDRSIDALPLPNASEALAINLELVTPCQD